MEEAVRGGSVTRAGWVMEKCLRGDLREVIMWEGMAWGQLCCDRRQKPRTGKQNKLQQLRMMGTETLYEEARDKVTQGDVRSEGLVDIWSAGHPSSAKDSSRASGEETFPSQAGEQRKCGKGLQT